MRVPHTAGESAAPRLSAQACGPSRSTLLRRCLIACFLSLAATTRPTVADEQGPPLPKDLTQLSLEQLMDIEVTSVSKRPESLQGAAAAVHVITGEEIQRLGITTIPEALRLVPGVQVARVNSYVWAITARGLNSTLADKLEVLLDGRSLYNPLFSGVYWDVQDTYIEDIDRIEVIRGPGATLWGANAVNGVINIITKKAADTQGTSISMGGGSEERAFVQGRYGGKVGTNGHYRVYAKSFERDPSHLDGGGEAADRWHTSRAGFRSDWELARHGSLTVQGDVYDGDRENRSVAYSSRPPLSRISRDGIAVSGGNVLAHWSKAISSRAEVDVQVYFDHTSREIPGVFREERDTYDVDFRNRISVGDRQEVVWGGGFRHSRDNERNTPNFTFEPEGRGLDLYNLFVQDEIKLVPDKLSLTLGSKLEHNDYTGFEAQPSSRLAWTPDSTQTIWTAVSRAVRTPNRVEHDASGLVSAQEVGPGQPGVGVGFFANDHFRSETLLSYEAGYRKQVNPRLSFDVTGFYNDYDNLKSTEQRDSPQLLDSLIVVPTRFENQREGEIYGAELSSAWQAARNWRLHGGYSYLNVNLRSRSGSTDRRARSDAGNDPEHQAFIQSSLDVSNRTTVDGFLRFVDALPNLSVPAYAELDLRVAWKPLKSLELSLTGQNLLHDQHREFGGATEIERGFYGALSWKH